MLIIDCHGHYTTAPKQLEAYRKRQIAEFETAKHVHPKGTLGITDDQIRDVVAFIRSIAEPPYQP